MSQRPRDTSLFFQNVGAFQVGCGYPHQRKCPVRHQRDNVDYEPSFQVVLELSGPLTVGFAKGQPGKRQG